MNTPQQIVLVLKGTVGSIDKACFGKRSSDQINMGWQQVPCQELGYLLLCLFFGDFCPFCDERKSIM